MRTLTSSPIDLTRPFTWHADDVVFRPESGRNQVTPWRLLSQNGYRKGGPVLMGQKGYGNVMCDWKMTDAFDPDDGESTVHCPSVPDSHRSKVLLTKRCQVPSGFTSYSTEAIPLPLADRFPQPHRGWYTPRSQCSRLRYFLSQLVLSDVGSSL